VAKVTAIRKTKQAAKDKSPAKVNNHVKQIEEHNKRILAGLAALVEAENGIAATLHLHTPSKYRGVTQETIHSVIKEDAEFGLDYDTEVVSVQQLLWEFEDGGRSEVEDEFDDLAINDTQRAIEAVCEIDGRFGITVTALLRVLVDKLREGELGIEHDIDSNHPLFGCVPGGYDEHGNGNDACTYNPNTGIYKHVPECRKAANA
jgi:hypothetical protein